MLLKKITRTLHIPYVQIHWNITTTFQIIKIYLQLQCTLYTCGTPYARQDFLHFLFFNSAESYNKKKKMKFKTGNKFVKGNC